jgi:hypothetical protein
MNRHGNAEYRHVGERYILELDSQPSGFRLVVWEAVAQGGEYVTPDGGNSFAWDAAGSEEYDTRDEGQEVMRKLTGAHGVRTWCQLHPYDGPRTSWVEENRGEANL